MRTRRGGRCTPPPAPTPRRRLPRLVAGTAGLTRAMLLGSSLSGCGGNGPGGSDVDVGPAAERQKVVVPGVHFTDVTARAGIKFRHTSGATGKKLLPETMGS